MKSAKDRAWQRPPETVPLSPGRAALATAAEEVSAAQAALEKVALGLLDGHARHCVTGGPEELQADRTDELMAAIGRLMRRG